jgi:hypothetical protein
MPAGAGLEWAIRHKRILLHTQNQLTQFLPSLEANGAAADPNFVAIGNTELIGKRSVREVPIPPGGALSDYVPFYFTPKSPMLYNIKTGYSGVTQRRNDEIVILVSSCQAMADCGVTMLYTDRHAYTKMVKWSANRDDLADMIDWDILRRHDFARDDAYPGKMDRYQAEALAHRHVPSSALMGVGCVGEVQRRDISAIVGAKGVRLHVVVRPEWYF